MWAFYAASFLVGLTSSQGPAIFDSKEYTRETSCMWPWAKQIGTPDNLKGKLLIEILKYLKSNLIFQLIEWILFQI